MNSTQDQNCDNCPLNQYSPDRFGPCIDCPEGHLRVDTFGDCGSACEPGYEVQQLGYMKMFDDGCICDEVEQTLNTDIAFNGNEYVVCAGDTATVTWNGYHNIQEVTKEGYESGDITKTIGAPLVGFNDNGHVEVVNLETLLGETRYFLCTAHPSSKFKTVCNPSTCQSACANYPGFTLNNGCKCQKCYSDVCKRGATTPRYDHAPATCISCKPGLISDGNVCVECPAGTYEENNECKTCAAGTYQELSGQTSCKECEAGTYQDLSGQTSCTGCAAGTYQIAVGQISCTTCATCGNGQQVKHACTTTTNTVCEDCSAGTYSDDDNSCKACVDGSTWH